MNVGLIDVDGHNFPNLALMKISAWHKAKGDHVEWCVPILHYERVYQSKVFDDTYSSDIDWIPQADEVIRGGTGYGLENKLPDEIEHMYPDYSLYPELTKDTAYGFLTRGCPRGCGFCIVASKEGRCSRKVADLSEFWDGQKNIILLDPNILACKDKADLLEQLVESRSYVNFSQGLDIRLVGEQDVDALNRMRIKRLHFAWDNPKDRLEDYFRSFSEMYRRKSRAGKVVYVLVNFGSTMEENLYRIYTLRDLGFDPFVMIYDKPNAPAEIKRLARWCNNKFIFGSCKNFGDYNGLGNQVEGATK